MGPCWHLLCAAHDWLHLTICCGCWLLGLRSWQCVAAWLSGHACWLPGYTELACMLRHGTRYTGVLACHGGEGGGYGACVFASCGMCERQQMRAAASTAYTLCTEGQHDCTATQEHGADTCGPPLQVHQAVITDAWWWCMHAASRCKPGCRSS